MKKLITLPVLLFLVHEIIAQENSAWVDSILNRILLHQIAVYNQSFKRVDHADIQMISVDTVVNCQWSRPKFVDNVFYASFDGVCIRSPIHFDTFTNAIDLHFIDFKTRNFDEAGNYLNDTTLFLINRLDTGRHYGVRKRSGQAKKLKHTKWLNSRILYMGKPIEPDSCHQLYRLQFDDDYRFHQSYGENQIPCNTQAMREEIDVGVEGDAETFFTYYNALQGHYIGIRSGIWQVEKNQLHLIDLDEKKVLIFEIEKLNGKELHLKLKGFDYRLMMNAAPF